MDSSTFAGTDLDPIARYSTMDPSDFGDSIDSLWDAAEQHKELTKQHVREGKISPQQGQAAIASLVAELFGYPQTHGRGSSSDVVQALVRGSQQPQFSRS